MATAYTPGLKVSPFTTIRKTRRLPLKGQVLVNVGESVSPETVVARAELPGLMQTVRVPEQLGVEPADVPKHLKVSVGDSVEVGTVLAETRSFFNLLRNECRSPIAGTVEMISPVSGHVGIRYKPTPVDVKAYVQGSVVEVIADEGVVVETSGAFIQGIFGVGGERLGEIRVLAESPSQITDVDYIHDDLVGKVVVAGANITGAAIRRAAEIGVSGIVVGGIIDRDLAQYVGYDIGVAITGHEEVNTTLIITEGFGVLRMADRTFGLLKTLEGRLASINGATQIRAGVIRPEIIVPLEDGRLETGGSSSEQMLEIGSKIRIIREPYFGMLGSVKALPPELVEIESGAKVRTLVAQIESGEEVIVPRANVEIIEE